MSQFNADDSDCIIQDHNITCITLDDSAEEFSDTGEPLQPPSLCQSIKQDMEEGEVNDDEDNINKNKTVCEIKFHTKFQFEKYGSLIFSTLKDNLCNIEPGKTLTITKKEDKQCVTFVIEEIVQNLIKELPMPALELCVKPEEETDALKREQSPDLSGLNELFTIDTEPAAKIDSVKVPSYKRAIKDVLLDEEAAAVKKQKEEEAVFKIKKSCCFNCGEADHSIRECSKPHNLKRIKNAKRACFKVERYHVDVEQKFAHIKPGCISNKLREALGLRNGELPFFFYRMRVLGYPPGWLEEAKVEHSGITLFNSDGSKILHSDEDEGEIDTVNHKYNISKIYDFPGFNQDPGKDFFDDYKYHNVPPLDKTQMKDEFIKTLGDNILKGYKRKKLKDFPNTSSEEGVSETTVQAATDMDIEDPETTLGEIQFTRPPPPLEQPPVIPPPPASPLFFQHPPHDNDNCKEHDPTTKSPSLMELEKQKQKLLQELQANSSVIEIEDSLVDEIIELDDSATYQDDKSFEQNLAKSDNSANKNSDNSLVPTAMNCDIANADANAIAIKESFMGTPILKFSPYDNLPNGDKFKVGVSDVINFENLPDSTGKYEQMKEVIQKVRHCIHKLQGEE